LNLVGRLTVKGASPWMANHPKKGAWLGHVNHLNLWGAPTISLERLFVSFAVNLVHRWVL